MDGKVEPRIKGVSFQTLRTAFVQLRGQDRFDESVACMPSALRDAYAAKTLLAASWYPLTWYREALAAFRATTHAGPELMRALGRSSVSLDMAGTYKHFLVKLLSPPMLLRLSGHLFRTYYDTGRFDVVEARKGMVTARLSDCLGWNQNLWTHAELVAYFSEQ
jgi:hypothetical protein